MTEKSVTHRALASEIKQFNAYFGFIMDRLKASSAGIDEKMSEEES